VEPAGTDNTVSWLAFLGECPQTTGRLPTQIRFGDPMRKPKTRADLLDTDWPPHQPVTLTELIAGARAVEWDFTTWCYASGYDATDPDARSMFECLLAYAKREGRAGLH
jgi:hypothetical protein